MRFRKIYVEISNICNLRCSFCPKTKREPRRMSAEEFSSLAPRLRPYTDYIYFHLMGEPLCHPSLDEFLEIAAKHGFKVIITTNGTLLREQERTLLFAPALHKINVSLHAFEANDLAVPFDEYLDGCFEFGKCAEGEKIVVYRLWNKGGEDELNDEILSKMKRYFPDEWKKERRGTRIADKIYVENGDKFDWPDLSADDGGADMFCYGLRDQLGVLSDGTVVPCCLDREGDLRLGNVFRESMEDILLSERASAIYNGFSRGIAVEELCRKCGYARRFKK